MTPARRALLRFLAVHAQTCGASPFVFLSYAWPVDSAQLAQIQDFLKQLAADLRTAGAADVFLDIERMNGSTAEYMETHIAKSDIIVVVCSERMKTRGNDAKTNAALELRAAVKRAGAGLSVVIPLLYDGDLDSSVPELIEPYAGAHIDFTDKTQYEANVVRLAQAVLPGSVVGAKTVGKLLAATHSPEAVLDEFVQRARAVLGRSVHVSVVAALGAAGGEEEERQQIRAAVQQVCERASEAGASGVSVGLRSQEGALAEEAHAVVVVCTPLLKKLGSDAKSSEAAVLREVAVLHSKAGPRRCRVVAAVVAGDAGTSMPPQLGRVPTVEFRQHQSEGEAVARVLGAVFGGEAASRTQAGAPRVALLAASEGGVGAIEAAHVQQFSAALGQTLEGVGAVVVEDAATASAVLPLLTPSFKAQSMGAAGGAGGAALHAAVQAVLARAEKQECGVVPLLVRGTFATSFAESPLAPFLFRDCTSRQRQVFVQRVVEAVPVGIVAAVWGLDKQPDPVYSALSKRCLGRLAYFRATEAASLPKRIHARQVEQAHADGLQGALALFVPPEACSTAQMADADRVPFALRLDDFLHQPVPAGLVPVLLVLGESGSGKSLALRKAEADLLAAYSGPQSLLPLRIDLKQASGAAGRGGRPSVSAIIERTLVALCEGRQRQLTMLRVQQQMVLILDGYDEISDTGGVEVRLFEALKPEMAKWELPPRIVVSCRTQFLGGVPPHDVLVARFAGAGAVLVGPIYVAPFTVAQIGAFVSSSLQADADLRTEMAQAVGGARGGLAEQCVAAVERVPGLLDLVRSPFLLTLALRALPKLLGRSGAGKVTRAELYETFAGRLFSGEYERRGAVLQRLAAAHPEQTWIADPENDTRGAFEAYCKALAGLLFRTGAVSAQASAGGEAGRLLSESDEVVREIRKGCPLRRNGASVSFVHKSFLEYFAATALVGDTSGGAGSLWSAQLLPRDQRGVMLFVADAVYAERISAEAVLLLDVQEGRKSAPLAQALLGMVVASRGSSSEGAGVAAANALTVLNYGGWTLSGLDLHGVQIAGADLQKALMDRVELRGAVLCGSVGGKRAGVNLSDADMRGSNLSECVFGEEVELGQYASMLVFLVSMLVAVGCQWSHR
eukprot:TRINITY_DN63_c0_g1_i15.p1 TRINITY_DN63_c0_g1~~TRINITY_DN63_c0_g1_i15.p1  ORF type:complete len:1169 (-),score=335.23 TRINITY_DN63_c0_g1_i15:36-3425(-)